MPDTSHGSNNRISSSRCSQLDLLGAVLAFLLSLVLNIFGLRWGLPSPSRTEFYPRDIRWYSAPQTSHRLYETAPYESYNPDEGAILNALSNMRPSRFDFNPHYFNYPTLSIYLTGAALKAGEVLGFVRLANSKEYYVRHPAQMGQAYFIGRLLAAFMGAVGVFLLYFCARFLFDSRVALFSAVALATTALWVRDAHFMLVNVPSAMWMIAAALAAAGALRRASAPALVLSAFLAGLAASTKYPAGAAMALTAYVWVRTPLPSKRLLAAALVGVFLLGFVVGTPYAVIAPGEFLRDITSEGRDKLSFVSVGLIAGEFVISQGAVAALLAAVGGWLTILHIRQWEHQFVVLWVMAGTATRVISGKDLIRYFVPATPPTALLVGIALAGVSGLILQRVRQHARLVACALCLALILPSAGYALNTDVVMRRPDARDCAAAWLAANVRPYESIGVLGKLYWYNPPIDAEKYLVRNLKEPSAQALPRVCVTSSGGMGVIGKYLDGDQRAEFATYRPTIFEHHPSWVWTWPARHYPEDWQYTFCDITVYTRS